MASKRMFSSKIIESADFLNLPHSTQNLYIHLSMGADDDGIVNNAKIVMRMTGCRPKDYQKLIENGYIIELSENLCVIKHWKINNNIRGDRYTQTIYPEALQMLDLRGKEYAKKDKENDNHFDNQNDNHFVVASKHDIDKDNTKENDSLVCNIYEDFCNKLAKAYPQARFDKETAYSMWIKRTNELNKDIQEASDLIGRAIWNYLSEYKKSHNEDGEIDFSYVPKLSNILGTQFENLVLSLIDKEAFADEL